MAPEILTYGATKQVIDLMSRTGLLNAAVYVAGKALSAGSQHSLIDRLSRSVVGDLEPYLKLMAMNWESFRSEEILKPDSAREAWVRLACHVPGLLEDNRYSHFFVPAISAIVHRTTAARALIDLSQDLAQQGEGDKAAAALVTAARPEFSSPEFLDEANKVAGDLPNRATPPSQDVVKGLTRAATSMALLNKYGLAFQTELIAKGGHADAAEYSNIGYRMLELAAPIRERTPAERDRLGDEINLGSKLWERGYWADAAEILEIAVGVPASNDDAWKDMWILLNPDKSMRGRVGAGMSLARNTASAIGSYFPALRGVESGGLETLPVGAGKAVAPAASAEPAPPPSAAEPAAGPAWHAELAEVRTRRRVNVDVRRVREAERQFRVKTNIGAPKAGTAGGPFHEPDWGDIDHLDLRLTLDGDADITPAWHDLRLEKTGDTPYVEFRVTAFDDHPLQLELRVYTARELMLLERYQLEIEVAETIVS